MAELWDRVVWMLIVIRDQCMPVTVGDDPGAVDYAVVGLATLGMVGGTVWFAWALRGKDTRRDDAIKRQVLED